MARCSNRNPHAAHDFYAALHNGEDPYDNVPDSRCEGVPFSFSGPPAMPVTKAEAEQMRQNFIKRHPELTGVERLVNQGATGGLVFSVGNAGDTVQMHMDSLTDMMTRQLQFQLKIDPDFQNMTGQRLIEFIRTHTLSLVTELCEMINETNWKPWATAEPGIVSRDRYIKEIIDAQHFLFNLALAAGVKPHEYYLAYIEKNWKNFDRQDNNYAGNNPRCEHCGNEIETYSQATLADGTENEAAAKWWCNDQCYDAYMLKLHNENEVKG